jgi:hypothetical protein
LVLGAAAAIVVAVRSGHNNGPTSTIAHDNRTTPNQAVSNTTEPNSLTTIPSHPQFNESLDWTGKHAFASGIHSVDVVQAPARYEMSTLSTFGTAQISVSNGVKIAGAQSSGPPQITKDIVFTGSTLQINGVQYIVAKQYQDTKLLVLPTDKGIVWIPTDQQQRLAQVFDFVNDHIVANATALKGATDIFYTPYKPRGGSLAEGMVRLASLPHAWMGTPEPVISSAWTGWLPANQVMEPHRQSLTGYLISPTTPDASTLKSTKVGHQFDGFPTSFDTTTPGLMKGEQPSVALVQSITRTSGGFVLSVGLRDPNHGGNAGITEADYYWSEAADKWVPLTQIYIVQTIVGFTNAGSNGVYWEEALPGQVNDDLYVAQMHYNPQTNTMDSLWLGNWVYGPSFTDGDSWVVQMPNQMQQGWTVYTPKS